VLGHSEGSLIGMMAAAKKNAAGFISVSGAGERIDKTLERQLGYQSEEMGMKAKLILDSLVAGYHVVRIDSDVRMFFNPAKQPYLLSWLKYDPMKEITKLKQPILIVQGTTDLQVRVADAENLKKASPRAQLKIIPGMNHVLKTAPEERDRNIATYVDPNLQLCAGFMPELIGFVKGLK
jgi:uncharacterized protein